MDYMNPAFPCHNDANKRYHYNHNGMTLRDYFAAKAMQALISVPGVDISHKEYADFAYKAADAMLKERNK